MKVAATRSAFASTEEKRLGFLSVARWLASEALWASSAGERIELRRQARIAIRHARELQAVEVRP